MQGPLAIAGVLTRKKILGTRDRITRMKRGAAELFHNDTASIQSGAFSVRTERGSSAHGRTHTDHYVYIPFHKGRGGHNASVMKIDQIILVKQTNMGWPNDEARLAIGTLYENLKIETGAGMEEKYNDDSSTGACCVPRLLWATTSKLQAGYPWIVHLRQVNCPVAYIPGNSGAYFITISKMGVHARKDLEQSI